MLDRVRPVVPFIGMTLVIMCGWSYFSIFRYTIVKAKWCGASTQSLMDEVNTCHWELVHGSVVVFLMVNIIGHYIWCTFGSPGVVGATSCKQTHVNITVQNQAANLLNGFHPDPNPSYCSKCKMERPARAHHCRICKQCILSYDHHCPWVNNCIGLNNYRSFVLLIFYILAGCTYGVSMLGMDFFQVMKQRIALYGWSIRGAENGTGILDLPLPWVLWRCYQEKGYMDSDVIVRSAFPLMLFVGVIMYFFFGYHMRIIIAGCTTLEDVSRPQFHSINPFDDGAKNNLSKCFGTSWFSLLIPVPHLPTVRNYIDGSKTS